MRHFTLKLLCATGALVTLSVLSCACFMQGRWPQGALAGIGALVAACLLVAYVRRLASLVATFMKAILAHDTTLRLDFGRRDPMLGDLSRDMNSIAEIYHESRGQLETSKLYYDRIIKIMTHEMRNYVAPVISITTHVEEHPESYRAAESLREVVGLIHSQSTGIRRFLDSYYRLTHLPPLSIETIEAADFAARVMQLVQGEVVSRGLGSGVCVFDVSQGMALNVDVALMTQAMLNLLRNALDAVQGREAPSVAVTISIAAGAPFITVTDNGAGIPPEIVDNLFQPFFTTKHGGSGVGLAISRQIVRSHGGDLRLLHSGHTTTFAITLPAQ